MMWFDALIRWSRRETPTPGRVPSAPEAVLFIALVAVGFFFGGAWLQASMGGSGLLAAQWLFLFVPALVFVRLGGFDAVATLSLRRPSASALAGAIVLMAGTTATAWLIGWIQTFFLPIPWDVLERLEERVRADSFGSLLWLLALLAVTPAFCEEIVFRGVLLGGTRQLHPVRMILLNGLVFGAFHLSTETVLRFLPTAWLGIVIAWAVWRTGSVWTGVFMHALNNGAIVLLASVPEPDRVMADPLAPPPLWLVSVAVAALWLGARGLDRLPRPAGPEHATTTSSLDAIDHDL